MFTYLPGEHDPHAPVPPYLPTPIPPRDTCAGTHLDNPWRLAGAADRLAAFYGRGGSVHHQCDDAKLLQKQAHTHARVNVVNSGPDSA